jgi:hypothetical protein
LVFLIRCPTKLSREMKTFIKTSIRRKVHLWRGRSSTKCTMDKGTGRKGTCSPLICTSSRFHEYQCGCNTLKEFKSRLSCRLAAAARDEIGNFLGASAVVIPEVTNPETVEVIVLVPMQLEYSLCFCIFYGVSAWAGGVVPGMATQHKSIHFSAIFILYIHSSAVVLPQTCLALMPWRQAINCDLGKGKIYSRNNRCHCQHKSNWIVNRKKKCFLFYRTNAQTILCLYIIYLNSSNSNTNLTKEAYNIPECVYSHLKYDADCFQKTILKQLHWTKDSFPQQDNWNLGVNVSQASGTHHDAHRTNISKVKLDRHCP